MDNNTKKNICYSIAGLILGALITYLVLVIGSFGGGDIEPYILLSDWAVTGILIYVLLRSNANKREIMEKLDKLSEKVDNADEATSVK